MILLKKNIIVAITGATNGTSTVASKKIHFRKMKHFSSEQSITNIYENTRITLSISD